MKHQRAMFVSGLLAALAATGAARATPEIFEYRIIHQSHGDIGRYTNIIERRAGETVVHTELHIAVTVLGIVAYRQDAERVERWQRDRLVAFDGITVTNGERLAIHGEAQGGGFAITTPGGTVMAPAHVHPSNPWSAMVLRTDAVMSTRTGRLFHGMIAGGARKLIWLDGKLIGLRQYEITTDKQEFVWLDDEGTPVAFRTKEDGEDIDFVLSRRETPVAKSG